jgi:hypothetical protein
MFRFSPRNTASLLLLMLTLALTVLRGDSSLAANSSVSPKSKENPASSRILEERTAFRWDPVFFVWAVHYPEKIVPLWVQEKKPGTKKAAEELRRFYWSTLRLTDSTAVLFSVFAYTQKPVNLNPLSRHLFLRRTADGKADRKIPPKSSDPIFDQPILGLKQGLVFFPKTPEPFELVLEIPGKSPIVLRFQEDLLKTQQEALSEKAGIERRLAVEKERKKWEAQVARLQQEIAKMKEAEAPSAPPQGPAPVEGAARENLQPELLARRFFEAWKNGDLALMQRLLSASLQKELPSKEALAAFLRKKALPERLPRDAVLEAVDGNREFRITLTTKVLLLKNVRRFGFSVEEAGQDRFAVAKME